MANLGHPSAKDRRVIVHTPEPGAGAGQYVMEFVCALAACDLPTVLFCPGNFAYKAEVAQRGVEIVCAPARVVKQAALSSRIWRNLTFAFHAARKFAGVAQKGDVVHFQFVLHLGLGLVYMLMAKMKGAAVVLTTHDPLPHRWILSEPLRWIETSLLALAYSLCDRLIVHNDAGREILTGRFHRKPEQVAVIPHGPLGAIGDSVTEEGTSDVASPLRLLAFGSLRENKGLHLSIAAIQHLQRVPGNRGVVLTIAGSVPNAMERPYWNRCLQTIEAQPAGIHVMERVVKDEEIGALFAAHDAVLLPYLEFFSDSGVAMLALSQRRPIIATAAGGLGQLLSESGCGILIESPSLQGVIEAVETATGMPPELLRQKGLAGHSYAVNHRSWGAIAKRTVALYDGLQRPLLPKVVLHTPEPASSAALYLDEISRALADDGVPVTVVCPANHREIDSMKRHGGIDVRVCADRGIRMGVSLAAKILDNLRFVSSSCLALLRAANPGDIVHLQYLLHLPFGLIFFLCARIKRARIILTVHDPLPHKLLFPKFLQGVELAALRLAYLWSDVLIVHSEAGKRKLVDRFKIGSGKIQVIAHGPYKLREKVGVCSEESRLEVLFFGSLRENKGLHLAIPAVLELVAEGLPVRLTIAGQVVNRKEEAYWESCRALIDSGCSAIRLIETFVPEGDLPALFSGAHCFLLPYTTFYSDSGVAYMALANAKPVLATASGGLGWLLENSQGGLRIAEASVPGIKSALRAASALGPAELERIGRAGADWVMRECGWPTVARDTREVYGKLTPSLNFIPPIETPDEFGELVGAGHE